MEPGVDSGQSVDNTAKTRVRRWMRHTAYVVLAAAALLVVLVAVAMVVVNTELAAKKWDAVEMGR